MGFLMKLPFEDLCDLIVVASEKIQEEQIRAQWVAMLPFMAIQWLEWKPFQEYLESCTGATIDRRPAQEIIDEILAVHNAESLEELGHGNI